VVIGTSPKAGRYSNMAVRRLLDNGITVYPLGHIPGTVHDLDIITDFPPLADVHTVTLYINPARQADHYRYILSLGPQRLIFNPGTENLELQRLAEEKGIRTVIGCTLVMLSVGTY
jgi:predicted CoA-binding protein